MRRFAFFALAAAAVACGIGVIGQDPLPGAPVADGSTLPAEVGSTPAAETGAPPTDAGGDAQVPDAGNDAGKPFTECEDVISDQFSAALDPRWQLVGEARVESGRVELTTDGSSIGVLWWKEPITWGSKLVVVFHWLQESLGGGLGAGIGVAWSRSDPSGKIGLGGLNFGVCNSALDGVGASLRWTQEPQRIDTFVGISGDCETHGGKVVNANVSSGILNLTLTPGKIEATHNAVTDDVAFATLSKTGYVGFGAATGGGASRYSITEAIVQRCP